METSLEVLRICLILGVGIAAGYLLFAAVSLVVMAPIFVILGVFSTIVSFITVLCCIVSESVVAFWNSVFNRSRSGSATGQERFSRRESDRVIDVSAQLDPYDVLDVDRAAGAPEIKRAYLRQMSLYHPDKVAHLGDELRTLAEEKAKLIHRAYSTLACH